LLRNAGFKADTETLTQDERTMLYQLRTFTQFRKDFTVQVASAYYNVLGNRDAIRNSYLNLQSSRRSAERGRAMAAVGRETQTDLGRLEQQELSAESAWIGAVHTYQLALDNFKIQIGVPMETKIVLSDGELEHLQIHHPNINVEDSIKVALTARLDLQNLRDQEEDTGRQIALAADQLRTQLDFTAAGGFSSPQQDHGFFASPQARRYNWNAGLALDLPLERTAERNNYRAALIAQAQAVRAVDLLQDQIVLQVRDSWRTLEQAKRTYEISVLGVQLAERRVEEQDLRAELGRANALDQVDAQNALNSSKDQRTQALVAHTVARLQFWDNMGILFIKDNGQWQEVKDADANPNK
jgi:outer membrane protein TolC